MTDPPAGDDDRDDAERDAGGGRDAEGDGDGHDVEGGGDGGERAEGDAVVEAVPARQLVAEAFAPARDLLSRASAFVALPEPRVLASDVRSLPPHERFTESASRHAERVGVDSLDPESIDAAAADLPVDEPVERATTFLVRRSGRLQGRLLGELASGPDDARPYLTLAVAAGHLQRVAADLQHAHETGDDDLEHLASVALALLATLFDLAGDGMVDPADRDPAAAGTRDPLDDDVYRDVALADHHRALARGGDAGTDPLDRDVDDLRHLVAVQGAVLAVAELDADPAAVADLADVPLEHLLGVLATD